MAQSKYSQYILSGEIRNRGDVQEFVFEGKDSRGCDFSLQISPIMPDSVDRKIPESVDADRVATYFGGNPDTIGDIGTEIEISIGDRPETYKIDSAAVIYIPKGQPFRDSVISKPDKISWLYSITLPPRYVESE